LPSSCISAVECSEGCCGSVAVLAALDVAWATWGEKEVEQYDMS